MTMARAIELAWLGLALAGGIAMTAETTELYRARFAKTPARQVSVVENASGGLVVNVTGFGADASFPVTGGGVSLCATLLKHRSAEARLDLTLPIADPRGRCRPLPPSISIRAKTITVAKTTLERTSGADQRLRAKVSAAFGEVQ